MYPRLLDSQAINVLAEFLAFLSEIRRVPRELEAGRNITMSPAFGLLPKLHNIIPFMAVDMFDNEKSFNYDSSPNPLE